ncbi:MAG TPA: hypothetical protein VGK30_12625 [Candidatus Binatia bacterium]
MARPVRIAAYTAALLVSLALIAKHRPPSPAPGDDDGNVTVARMEVALTPVRARIARDPRNVVVVGDSSMLSHYTLPPDETLAALLEHDAPTHGLSVSAVAFEGFDAVAYYLLADELAALHPRAVVLIANLQTFTAAWFRRTHMKHPQLAAFVRPRRALEAMLLPLEQAGITNASLVVLPILRLLGASTMPAALNGYRVRFHDALDTAATSVRAGDAIADAAPLAPGPLPGPKRRLPPQAGIRPQGGESAFRRVDLYPQHLRRDQATIQILAAAVRDLRRHGVRVVVALAPIHLQALQMTGALTGRDIPGALTLVREITRARGGISIDLSEALPRGTYFTDVYTHFSADGNRLVAEAMLTQLANALADDR